MVAETGSQRSPLFFKGAFVQLVPGLVGVVPNIVTFQFNPEKISHTLTPWNPFEVDQAQRGAQAPTVQPFDPKETFNLTLEFDASDDMANGDPIAISSGVADWLAAMKKLTQPTAGVLGDFANSAAGLLGQEQVTRPTVPIILFVWGPGRILPVRVTSFSVEETLFSPALYPVQAAVTVGLEVMTPDVFKCQEDVTARLAVAAYKFTRLQDDALAVLNAANPHQQILSLLPF